MENIEKETKPIMVSWPKPCPATQEQLYELNKNAEICSCTFPINAHYSPFVVEKEENLSEKDEELMKKLKILTGNNNNKTQNDYIKSLFLLIKKHYEKKFEALEKLNEEECNDKALKQDWTKFLKTLITTVFSSTRLSTYIKTSYFIDGRIGIGKDGVQIYRAYQENTHDIVAVKIFSESKDAELEYNNALLLKNSKHVLLPIDRIDIDHPGIKGVSNGLVLPLLICTISDFLLRHNYEEESIGLISFKAGSLPPSLTCKIIEALYNVALEASKNGLCVCDLKLQNCGIDRDGYIKVFDFGGLVKIGEDPFEYTRAYSLGTHADKANGLIDLTCLAVCACLCADNNFILDYKTPKTLPDLKNYLKLKISIKETHIGWSLAHIFLKNQKIMDCKEELECTINKLLQS